MSATQEIYICYFVSHVLGWYDFFSAIPLTTFFF